MMVKEFLSEIILLFGIVVNSLNHEFNVNIAPEKTVVKRRRVHYTQSLIFGIAGACIVVLLHCGIGKDL